MIDDLTLPILIGAALVDSINPCAIGVILFLSSVLLRVSSSRRTLLFLGGVYISTVYVVYVLAGLGLVWFQHALISRGYAEIVGVIVGSLVVALGLVELKDVFWYGKGISLEIAPRHRETLTRMAERISLLSVVAIGAFVAAVELPCTGGPYLAVTAILAKSFDLRAFLYLLLYNVIFVLPLVLILTAISLGASTYRLKKWRQEQRRWMNLASGLLMIVLGGFLIAYYAYGWYL